jgi:hypothetical protein
MQHSYLGFATTSSYFFDMKLCEITRKFSYEKLSNGCLKDASDLQ